MTLRDEIMALSRRHTRDKMAEQQTGRSKAYSCDRKVAYTYSMALYAVKHLKHSKGAIVEPYKCHFCGHWHVGSSATTRRK